MPEDRLTGIVIPPWRGSSSKPEAQRLANGQIMAQMERLRQGILPHHNSVSRWSVCMWPLKVGMAWMVNLPEVFLNTCSSHIYNVGQVESL